MWLWLWLWRLLRHGTRGKAGAQPWAPRSGLASSTAQPLHLSVKF